MGHSLPATLIVCGATFALVIRRITGVFSAESLRPLSQNAQAAIDTVGGRTSRGPEVEMKTSDLLTLAINSRRMVAESDRIRSSGKHSGELDDEHERLLQCGRILAFQIPLALLERIELRFFGFEMGYYQTSAAWYYRQQQHGLDFISSESGIPLPENWEAQI